MKCPFLAGLLLACYVAGAPALAGARSEGKYCGVVLFDRWDACYLYSGVYLMYISEKVKEGLRPYAGQAVQIDATDVYQPSSLGDGLIRAYKVLGPAPDAKEWWKAPVNGLAMRVAMRVVEGKPEFRTTVANEGKFVVKLLAEALAPTLLVRVPVPMPESQCYPWDGPSRAVITRYEMDIPNWVAQHRPSATPLEWPIIGWLSQEESCYGRVTSGPVPSTVPLVPGQMMVFTLLFSLPPGEYEFLCGYGGGVHESKCVASNLVPFDVDADRVAHVVPLTP